MLVNDLIQSEEDRGELLLLQERCSQFIKESNGLPLFKNLPSDYGDFYKVKVRKRRLRKEDTQELSDIFNEAFEEEHKDLRERAIFANGSETFEPLDNVEFDKFYIFPINGYQFMFSKEVENSSSDYEKVINIIFEEFGPQKGNELITELLKFTYKNDSLEEGIRQGSEIIIYNIPYFYAIRCSTFKNYENLLSTLKKCNNM